MIISFTGHRDRLANRDDLLAIEKEYPGATWVHGGARGFDSQVDQVARLLGKSESNGLLVVIKPDYARYPMKIAPLERNKIIVDQGDVLYALYDGRGKGGTLQTKNYAKNAGKPVIELKPSDGSRMVMGKMVFAGKAKANQ